MLQQLSDSRSTHKNLEHQLNSLTTQLNERQLECSELNDHLHTIQTDYDTYRQNSNDTINAQHDELQKKLMEVGGLVVYIIIISFAVNIYTK